MKSLMLRRQFTALALLALLLPLFACSRQESARENPAPSRDPLLQERIAKDEAFKSGPDSPIPADKRKSFTGLKYYPIDDSLRFTLKLQRYPNPEPVRLSTNTGEIRSGLRYGYFEFTVNGQSCRLQVYRLDGGSGSPSLFIPFRDATSGDETYASGRYIDLAENTSGTYVLDFNQAYNPYCAFNSAYSCPLTPTENILTVPIRAGEKKP